MAALAPPGCFVNRYFPGRQTVAGIVLKLASRDVPAAQRGPRMRQDRRRLCGSPPRHKRAASDGMGQPLEKRVEQKLLAAVACHRLSIDGTDDRMPRCSTATAASNGEMSFQRPF